MIPLSLISLFTAATGWKKLALGLCAAIVVTVLLGLAAWRGYKYGHAAASQKYQVQIAVMQADHATAQAQANAIARARLEAAITRANKLERNYLAATHTIKKQANTITKQRIAHASRNTDGCNFDPEWVRLYNKAIGACDGSNPMPASATRAAGGSTPTPATGSGVLPANAVTAHDILAHIRDYGRRNRQLAAQLQALIDWAHTLERATP